MTEDLLEREQPNFHTEQENAFLDRINFVSVGNALDDLLIDYQHQILKELTPSALRQRELIRQFRMGDVASGQELVSVNSGLIAALAYPYKAVTFDNFEFLMSVGESALLEGAMSYDLRNSKEGFTDFVSRIIDTAFRSEFQRDTAGSYIETESRPMLSVYRFMATLKTVASPEDLYRKQRQDKERIQGEVLTTNASWLQYLNLPNDEVEQKLGIDISTFYKKMKAVMEMLDIPNRATLALLCMDEGIVFDVPVLPEGIEFTDHQLKVVSLIHHSYTDIAKKLGVTFPSINKAATILKAKMGARSRTEIAIMARMNNIVPVEDDTPEYLRGFTAFQRELIPHLVLEDTQEIMEKTGLSKDGVSGGIARMMTKLGLEKRRQLALWLFNQGYEFEISEPLVPLGQILKSDKLELLQNLDITDEQLAELTGLSVSRIHYDISQASKKTGARNRTELLLMAHKFGNGEFAKPSEKQTKLQQLASKLGLLAIDPEHLNELLEKIGQRERTLIRDYYFSGEDVSWRTVANEHGFGRTLSIVTARNGILRLKRLIDAQKKP